MPKRRELVLFSGWLVTLVACGGPDADSGIAGFDDVQVVQQAVQTAAFAPSVAVVLCRQSYDASPRESHMSSQALVGLAGLVGTPYDTVTLDQLLALPVGSHASLWFGQCRVLSDSKLEALADRLSDHIEQGGTVLLDGPLGAYRPGSGGGSPTFRGSDETEDILQVDARGFADVEGFTVRTASGNHPLSSLPGWSAGTTLTQGLSEGTQVVGIAGGSRPGAHTLLQLGQGSTRHPYAVITQPGSGRVLAISGFGNDAGATTPFRNSSPSGFFDNLLLPRLIDATTRLLGGGQPTVGLQLSHAPLTAIVRLDGDVSDSPSATEKTLSYLLDLGRRTGVTTAYAIVSGLAQDVDWDGFETPQMKELERLGGSIGSHSHTHKNDMSNDLGASGWDVEVRQSMKIIRDHFTSGSFRPAVDVFINPGDTIAWADYRRFFKDVRAYFTHGFELSVPYTSGMSGFDLPSGTAPVALFGNTPVPDYQWFYDPEWSYGLGEATEIQRGILGYFQRRLGRGALYNQMWHDYGIAGNPPDHDPGGGPFDAFYDAIREHFATQRVYAPAVAEVTTKLGIAQRSRFSSQWSDGDSVVTTSLDLARIPSNQRAQLAGMGLRVNRPGRAIIGVTVDGAAHAAFTSDTVILPRVTGATAVVAVTTGDAAAAAKPRLTYLSKAPGAMTVTDGSLRVELARTGLATRFCLVPPTRHVLIGADRYAPDGAETCGGLVDGSSVGALEARAVAAPGQLSITAADRRVLALGSQGEQVKLDVAAGKSADRLSFRASEAPGEVRVGSRRVTPVLQNGVYRITLGTSAAATVTFDF
jgi:hypothetical protein